MFLGLFEIAFDAVLKIKSPIGDEKVKNFTVSVEIKNQINTTDPLRKLSLLVGAVLKDTLKQKKRCELYASHLKIKPDVKIVLTSSPKGILVLVESDYFHKDPPQTELAKALQEFVSEMQKFFDEVIDRENELIVSKELMESTQNQRILEINKWVEHKIHPILFKVMVYKCISIM